MKRINRPLVVLAATTALIWFIATPKSSLVRAVYAQSGCSNSTLSGNYPFIYKGDDAPGHAGKGLNNTPQAAVGVLTLDGSGGAFFAYTVVSNGSPSSTSVPDTGVYTLHSDCTGTLTDATAGLHFNIVSAGGGAEIFGIQIDPSTTDTFVAKRQ